MPWLPLNDAAQIYQCSTRTLRRYISKGQLTSKLAEGQRMVWLAEQVQTVSTHKKSIPKERYIPFIFELFEGLSSLRMRFEGPLEMADFLEKAAPPFLQEKTLRSNKHYKFFFEHFDRCFREIDQLLNSFELDLTIFRNIYRMLVILKSHWQESGLYLYEERAEEPVKMKNETLLLLDHLIDQVRHLLVLSAQQSSTETESHSVLVQKGIRNVEMVSRADTKDNLAFHPQGDTVICIPSSNSEERQGRE